VREEGNGVYTLIVDDLAGLAGSYTQRNFWSRNLSHLARDSQIAVKDSPQYISVQYNQAVRAWDLANPAVEKGKHGVKTY
jgi:hypothetical protein